MREADGHDQLFTGLKRAAHTSDRRLLFVSAGVDPSQPVERQRDAFWWGGRGFEQIAAPYDGFERTVRGTDFAHHGVILGNHFASIDGGCGFGGSLVAACFDAGGAVIETIEA